jgi:hypothetical protein
MDKEFDPKAMDDAAEQARQELDTLPQESVATIAEWWMKWYLTAGHKRLGRVMVSIGKEIAGG